MGFRVLVDSIRMRLRAWLGIREPVKEKPQPLSVAQALLRAAGEKNVATAKFGPPALPVGVVPTNTVFTDDPGRLGPYVALDSADVAPAYTYANNANCGLSFPGYPYLAELAQRSEYLSPSETIAQEMTREFIEFVVKGKDADKKDTTKTAAAPEKADTFGMDLDLAAAKSKPTGGVAPTKDPLAKSPADDKIEKLKDAMKEFKVVEAFGKCALLDGLFGRAQLFIDIEPKGTNEDELRQLPLVIDKETIPQGSLRGFKVIEPMWTTPYTYNANDPFAPDFYKPKAWFVLGKRIHASRLLTFIMREVPDMLKPAYNFGGLSMTQLLEPYVFQWLRTRNSVSDLIHNFSVMVLKTNMSAALSDEGDGTGGSAAAAGVLQRAQLFVQFRDNQGVMMLDKDSEELQEVHASLASLDKLQAQAQEHMAAPSHIPLVKLLGVTPTGLNATPEGEIQVFYDFVRSCQQKFYTEHLTTVIQILQLHLFGEIDESISFEYKALTSPTVKEEAEIRKSDSDRDATYIDRGVISPEETRKRLAADPKSGYTNLSGPAPTPPMEQDHALSEESADNAHARSEEAAESAHERTKELATETED